MANSFIQNFLDAEIDAVALTKFIYRPANEMVERRLAPPINTLQYYLDAFEEIRMTEGYENLSKNLDKTSFYAVDINTAINTEYPSSPSRIQTSAYNDSGKGAAIYKRSTLDEVNNYPSLAWFQTADGAYWLLNEANPTPEMFGAKGDLKWQLVKKGDMAGINADTYGPRLLSGTNDLAAFNAAINYAKIRGCSKIIADGNYYIKSFNSTNADGVNKNFDIEFEYNDPADIVVHAYDALALDKIPSSPAPSNAAKADAQHYLYDISEYSISGQTVTLNIPPETGITIEVCQKFTVSGNLEVSGTLWTHYAVASQGVSAVDKGTRYKARLTIGQYSYNGFKPANNGQYGSILGIGSGFLQTTDHVLVEDIVMDSELIRAARVLGDPASGVAFQDSDASQMCIGYGNIRDVHFVVDPYDAATNTASLMLCLLHWGGRYTPPGGKETIDKGAYPIEKTWHPEGCTLTTKKVLKSADHIFFKGFELASTINCTVSDVQVDGVTHVYWVGVGDVSGTFAQGTQRNRVNTGNRIGHVTGHNINVGSELYAVLFKGEGTSKFERYAGTDVFLQRQGDMDLVVKSHTIYCNSGSEVIRLRGVRGSVDLGVCRLFGCQKSLFVLSGIGKWSADIAAADGIVHVRGQKGGSLKRTNVDMGSTRNSTASGLTERGYESKNCTVYLEGSYPKTTLTSSLITGATSLPIVAFSSSLNIVSPGDIIKITSGGLTQEVRATDFVVAGGLSIACTPLTSDVATGAVVELDSSVEMDYINMTSKSSEYGLYSENAVIKKLDFSDMGWSGRHSARLYNTRANMIGRLPSSDARRIVATSDQGIWADSKCRLVGLNLEIPKGSDGDEAIFLQSTSGVGATITMIGGIIEDISTFAPSANYPINQINLNGTVDKFGQLVVSPGRRGSNLNGYWVKHLDGSMECWARNIALGSSKPYIWTFPQPFIDTATTFVSCESSSVTEARTGSAISISATQAHAWLNKNDATGTDANPAAGMNLYAKGFWK